MKIDRVLIAVYGNEITLEAHQLANEFGIVLWGEKEIDRVEEYVMNRQKKLEEVMKEYKCSKEQAKNLFIIMLFLTF
jgi:hypothetical protein